MNLPIKSAVGKLVFVSIAALTLGQSALCLPPAQARSRSLLSSKTASAKALQTAVDMVFTNPALAEQKLKAMPAAAAKAYLAFLYFSGKIKTPGAAKKVDNLMYNAFKQLDIEEQVGDIDTSKKWHYSDMKTFLTSLRFISESNDDLRTPTKLFEQYPQECATAFGAYYYSSKDRADHFELSSAEDVFLIPQIKALDKIIGQIYGDPNPALQGTMMHGFYRNQRIAAIELSLGPSAYEKHLKTADGKTQMKEVADFLKLWSTKELWNNQTYLRLKREKEAAVEPLAAHYRKHFKVDEGRSRALAKAGLEGYGNVYFDNFSHSSAKDEQSSPIYKIFSQSGLTADAAKRAIGQRKMSTDELSQALTLSILCNGATDTIEWLIKLGAPLESGVETPLFSAVKRPEVVSLLLKSGAQAKEENALGKTALIQAAQYNSLPTIKLLLDAGLDINHKMLAITDPMPEKIASDDEFNYTAGSRNALMYAAAFADKATIEYLLSKGADKEAKDSQGWKALKFLDWNHGLSKEDRRALTKLLN